MHKKEDPKTSPITYRDMMAIWCVINGIRLRRTNSLLLGIFLDSWRTSGWVPAGVINSMFRWETKIVWPNTMTDVFSGISKRWIDYIINNNSFYMILPVTVYWTFSRAVSPWRQRGKLLLGLWDVYVHGARCCFIFLSFRLKQIIAVFPSGKCILKPSHVILKPSHVILNQVMLS